MVMIVVSVLLGTTNCSTRREDSSGNRSYEVGGNSSTEKHIWLFFIAHVSITESSDSSG